MLETTVSTALADDEAMIREFILEANEHLASIENGMLALEQDAGGETMHAIFRGFHTIKGLAGFLEFTAIQTLTHEVETLLDLARTGTLAVSGGVVDVVLESSDIVRQELARIEQRLAGQTAAASRVDNALLERIRAAARGEAAAVKGPAVAVEAAKSHEAASLRIDTGKLDELMEMVGELAIAQAMVAQHVVVNDGSLTRLARIAANLQRVAMSMRMVPLGAQFQKTARVVRDLSRRVGKQIAFETAGEETELDKTIVEALADPLLHMIRNSIDHGIETPEERVAMGKDATARIRLAASHQAGQIVIAISDDGRGLNKERILAKALQHGLIRAGQEMTEDEIFMLIFEAGFSTAEKVTDISGRGVGMDVVRRHVQALRGRIEIVSKAHEGTTFFIKLPLTLALMDGLVVAVGSERYLVPVSSVREMLRPAAERMDGECVTFRGTSLEVVRLHALFGVTPRSYDFAEGTLVVCETEGQAFALFVDEVMGRQEVLSKSLGASFEEVRGFAGCAILGDGHVALVLDVDAVYQDGGHAGAIAADRQSKESMR
ncbi:two-component system, chemotaxis family, sensor kinase CheA [Granulicella pectinivorans]|uniref:Chemotaxis protein CheA n=1 Tax=Granulicella pectinivorans TaxID=474950 RepID=A0A1I6L276_9BACT|nr:chemotaxis protein CheA [Granulicella pectinivorans]SFR97569.1 two-component system, chemotaxis family, sensor kinase CheA [Granulicella pectinivorans]